jgi:hypothetical protein
MPVEPLSPLERERKLLEAALMAREWTQFASVDIGRLGNVHGASRSEIERRFSRRPYREQRHLDRNLLTQVRRRGSSRGQRTRRVVRSAAAQRDGPPSDDDEPPDVAHLRGFAAANVRMYEHVARRIAAQRAA